MKCLIRLKQFAPLLIILILMTACGEIDETSEYQKASSPHMEEGNEEETSGLFSGIDNYKVENPKAYYNDELKFGVEYPSAWEVNIEGEDATELPNGDIENGIYIYANSNKNNTIYVFNKGTHIFIPPQAMISEKFLTEDGVDGEILYKKSEGNITIHLVLGAGFNGAYIIMSETSFEEYKEQIYAVLKSIKISDDEK